jgi:mannan endo-1,4-beta-mannosidase
MLRQILSLGLLAQGVLATPTETVNARQVSASFVTVKGDKFQLDGKDFYFAGTNAYYFPFSGVRIPASTSWRKRSGH